MKAYLILLFLVISLNGFSQKNTSLIAWSESASLNWKDFKGKSNRTSSFKALTTTSISFGINYENTTLTIEIKTEFDPNKSWTKVKENPNLLSHERLHFDIAELFARKLRQKILETTFKHKGKKLMNEITGFYQEIMSDLDKYQRTYDRETKHSIIEEVQQKWEKKTHKELAELSKYSDTTLHIQLGDL